MLRVGTKVAPPFAMKSREGQWSGISIDLWRGIAARMHMNYRLVEYDLQALLDSTASGRLDAAVAALTATASREARMDFSHPFHTSGLCIAVRSSGGGSWLKVVRKLFTFSFVRAVAGLALLLLLVGVLAWALERRRNPGHFGGGPIQGILSGFWWSAVTMTTVGYGDKAPVTPTGRILAVVWMFAGIITVSTFTAAITTALTVTELDSSIDSIGDLRRVSVGTVARSSSRSYLAGEAVAHREFDSLAAALNALNRGAVEAVVYDAPLLKYLVHRDFRGSIRVLPNILVRQDYAIAFPPSSPLKEKVNREILKAVTDRAWNRFLNRYLGP